MPTQDAAQTGCEIALNPSVEHAAAMKAGTADPFKEKGCFGLCYQVVYAKPFIGVIVGVYKLVVF